MQALRANFLVALSFSVLGIATGYMTGLSREPAVNAILPAVLSLIAGVSIYWIGKQESQRNLVSLSVLCLSTTLLVGAIWGARERFSYETYKESLEFLKFQVDRNADIIKHKAHRQIEIDQYLKTLEEFRASTGLEYYTYDLDKGTGGNAKPEKKSSESKGD
jgi:hypothetical protein